MDAASLQIWVDAVGLGVGEVLGRDKSSEEAEWIGEITCGDVSKEWPTCWDGLAKTRMNTWHGRNNCERPVQPEDTGEPYRSMAGCHES